MACRKCLNGRKEYRLCRCCVLVDKHFVKKLVYYCSLCGVYLCVECQKNPVKRVLAFGKQFFI